MPFSGITKSEEDPSHPPRAVEGEDVLKATRNLAHGQSLDLRKRIAQELHLASGQKTDRKKGLPRQGARARTPPGQVRGHPPGAPSGCSRAASCGLLWTWPLLGRSSPSRPLRARFARAAPPAWLRLRRLGPQLLWVPPPRHGKQIPPSTRPKRPSRCHSTSPKLWGKRAGCEAAREEEDVGSWGKTAPFL